MRQNLSKTLDNIENVSNMSYFNHWNIDWDNLGDLESDKLVDSFCIV